MPQVNDFSWYNMTIIMMFLFFLSLITMVYSFPKSFLFVSNNLSKIYFTLFL